MFWMGDGRLGEEEDLMDSVRKFRVRIGRLSCLVVSEGTSAWVSLINTDECFETLRGIELRVRG
jgi:hypothetical protein